MGLHLSLLMIVGPSEEYGGRSEIRWGGGSLWSRLKTVVSNHNGIIVYNIFILVRKTKNRKKLLLKLFTFYG